MNAAPNEDCIEVECESETAPSAALMRVEASNQASIFTFLGDEIFKPVLKGLTASAATLLLCWLIERLNRN